MNINPMRNNYLIVFLTFLLFSCEQEQRSNKSQPHFPENDAKTQADLSKKTEFELANGFKASLIKKGIDTVIIYQRTCIDCCDFYAVIWVDKGQSYLQKYYLSLEDNLMHAVYVKLNKSTIFNQLKPLVKSLPTSTIKDNMQKQKDGSNTMTMSAHYCYSSLSVFTHNDSIFSGQMKDIDFYKYANSDASPKMSNINYQHNIHSPWYQLLQAIETEVLSLQETSAKELEIRRINK